jgi:2-methylisocitrate lyase-like PEP mutase family enzyme
MVLAESGREAKVAAFRALHNGPGFIIPNPADAGEARLLASLGFHALATTSAGAAWSAGRPDGALGMAGTLENASAIVAATPLPVSADLGDGFSRAPEEMANTIRAAAASGLVGGSIEDVIEGDGAPLADEALAVARVAAAVEAARAVPGGFVLTARAEAHLFPGADLDATIRRLRKFSDAGADVLYAPGLPSLDAIRAVCAAVSKPVNVLLNPAILGLSAAQVFEAGARRISVGGLLARAALGGFLRAATELRTAGTIGFAAETPPSARLNEIMHVSR